MPSRMLKYARPLWYRVASAHVIKITLAIVFGLNLIMAYITHTHLTRTTFYTLCNCVQHFDNDYALPPDKACDRLVFNALNPDFQVRYHWCIIWEQDLMHWHSSCDEYVGAAKLLLQPILSFSSVEYHSLWVISQSVVIGHLAKFCQFRIINIWQECFKGSDMKACRYRSWNAESSWSHHLAKN
jgi:hypothetical protein